MKLFEGILIGVATGAAIGISTAMLFKPDNTLVENVPHHADSGESWVYWHQSLVSRFGIAEANQLFILAYNNQSASNIMSDSTTRQYFQSQGLVFDENWLNATIDFTHSIFSGIGNGISGFFKTGKTVVYILVGGFVLSAVLIIKGISNHPEYIGTAARAAL